MFENILATDSNELSNKKSYNLTSDYIDLTLNEMKLKITYRDGVLKSQKIENEFTNYATSKSSKAFLQLGEIYDSLITGKQKFENVLQLHDMHINFSSKETKITRTKNILKNLTQKELGQNQFFLKFYIKGKKKTSLRIWCFKTDNDFEISEVEIILIDLHHLIYRDNIYEKKYKKIFNEIENYKYCISNLRK